MELVVDLSTGDVVLRQHQDLHRFSVQARLVHPGDGPAEGALGALSAALRVHEVGAVGPDGDVLVPAAAVRRLAVDAAREDGSSLDSDWEAEFSGMVQYAAAKGWTSEDGALRAHVEWEA
jgi:hypothetical protein